MDKVPTINLDAFVRTYKVKKGENVTFDLSFTSPIKPVVEWFVNGTVIKKSNRVSIQKCLEKM